MMLRRVFGFMWLINVSIGSLGYALYGTAVLPKFVDNFPPSLMTTFIRAAMAYNLQVRNACATVNKPTLPCVAARVASLVCCLTCGPSCAVHGSSRCGCHRWLSATR